MIAPEIAIKLGGGDVNGRADTQVTFLIDDRPAWKRLVNLFDEADVCRFAEESAKQGNGINADDIRTILIDRAEEARQTGFIPKHPTEEEMKAAFGIPLPPEMAWMRRETAGRIVDEHPDLKPHVIYSILRRTEVANVIASPKMKKSWMVLGMALSVADGIPWLGQFRTQKDRVLLIDDELHKPTLAHRIPRVANAIGASKEALESLHIVSLRGVPMDITGLDPLFRDIIPRTYGLVIIDALYKLLPADTENDNSAMAAVYAMLDKYAAMIDAAIVVVHHSSKGIQGGKSVTDVGAGAGAQSRAADTHIVLREHEDQDCAVVDAVVRSWEPLKPFGIRWSYPQWCIDESIDVARIRRESKGGRPRKSAEEKADKPAEELWTPERFTSEFVGREPVPQTVLISRASRAGIPHRTIAGLIAEAQHLTLIYRHGTGRTTGAAFSTEKPTLFTESAQRESAHTTPRTPQSARRKKRRDSEN